MKTTMFYLPGRLYDIVLGLPLRGVRRKIAAWIARENLFPCLDVCCGTGSQVRAFDGHLKAAVIGLDIHPGMLRYAAARTPGAPFVQGDARRLPFRNGVFRAVSISFGLHEKTPEDRLEIVKEAHRVMTPDGKLICVDFENPWNRTSRFGAFGVDLIERIAGGDHYRNSRRFLELGGLRSFLREAGLREVARRDIETGSLSIVAALGYTESPK
ncbi:MAG: methyltransferase domain-containing protein [Acidobacteriota bacterium]|nr:methyltransferase domain-containing protein [Acidobacteriota bacterium]